MNEPTWDEMVAHAAGVQESRQPVADGMIATATASHDVDWDDETAVERHRKAFARASSDEQVAVAAKAATSGFLAEWNLATEGTTPDIVRRITACLVRKRRTEVNAATPTPGTFTVANWVSQDFTAAARTMAPEVIGALALANADPAEDAPLLVAVGAAWDIRAKIARAINPSAP